MNTTIPFPVDRVTPAGPEAAGSGEPDADNVIDMEKSKLILELREEIHELQTEVRELKQEVARLRGKLISNGIDPDDDDEGLPELGGVVTLGPDPLGEGG